ncbi:hypothetical protein CC80DRAFT_75656 [Byssothecium circinans]|uniref:G domain-containing protein n=1 Tax=Byssothecium circinans TaxID=147558 RepID=A0A6A5TWF6_9PLEO|nr:hypothetical protein CC80DRAFT_75656 [Byssothecium circinans]
MIRLLLLSLLPLLSSGQCHVNTRQSHQSGSSPFKSMARGTSQPTKEIPLKLVVIGKRGVGNTALIKKLVNGEFIKAYNPISTDRYSARRTLGVQEYAMEIIDTGSEVTYGDSRACCHSCSYQHRSHRSRRICSSNSCNKRWLARHIRVRRD